MAVVVSDEGRLDLPPDMVDADWLCEVLGFSTGDAAVIGPEAYAKLAAFERAVDDARIVGRLKRYVVRDPSSRAVLGFCYKRRELDKLLLNRG